MKVAVGVTKAVGLVTCSTSKNVHTTYGLGNPTELSFSALDQTDIEAMLGTNRNSTRVVMPVGLPKSALYNTLGVIPARLVTQDVTEFFQCGVKFKRSEITGDNNVRSLAQWLDGSDPDDEFYIVVCPIALPVFFMDKVTSGPIDENTITDLADSYGEDVSTVWLTIADTGTEETTAWLMANHTKLGTKFKKPDVNRRPIVGTMRIKVHRVDPDYDNQDLKDEINELKKRIVTLADNPRPRSTGNPARSTPH